MKFLAGRLQPKLVLLLLLTVASFACNKEETYENLPIYGPTQVFYALTTQNTITVYNAKDVRVAKGNFTITGLATAENMLAIDFRPATGDLYGMSSLSKLYTIDLVNGSAKAVSATAFAPLLTGTMVSMDFNPTTDRIRVITNSGQNLRINPETGIVEATDPAQTNLGISGISHSNSYGGSTNTILYQLDAAGQKLLKQDPINTGILTTVGSFEQTIDNATFEISPDGANALSVGQNSEGTRLFKIDLISGKATVKGKFVAGTSIRSIAIPAFTVAYVIDNTNALVTFNASYLTPTFFNKAITGLQPGETIYGMDIRPFNGVLYVLGSTGRVYTINLGNAAATVVGSGPIATALSGTSFGFDFNPQTDLISVVSNTGQNISINPTTLAITVNSTVTPAGATISGAGFANNFRSASATTLYVVDHTTDKLYKQALNTGVLTEVGKLEIDITAANGFDLVYAGNDFAFGAFTVGSKTSMYQVDLATGKAEFLYDLPKSVQGLAMGLQLD
jgi:hypothetical protein